MNMTDAKGKLHSFRKRTRYIDRYKISICSDKCVARFPEDINVFNNIHNLQTISIRIMKLLAM